MYSIKNAAIVLIAFAAIVVLAGCSSMGYINPRQISVDDIITMTTQGVSKDVIIQHINSTHSRYKLTAEDVVKLSQAKVDPDVIKAMLQTENKHYPGTYNYDYWPWGYPNWGYPYYYNYYWYDYPRYYDFYQPYNYQYYYRGDEGRRDEGYRDNTEQQRGNEERGNTEQRRGGGEQRGGTERRDK